MRAMKQGRARMHHSSQQQYEDAMKRVKDEYEGKFSEMGNGIGVDEYGKWKISYGHARARVNLRFHKPEYEGIFDDVVEMMKRAKAGR